MFEIGPPIPAPSSSANIAIIAASLSFLFVFLLSLWQTFIASSKEGGEFFSAYFIHRRPITGVRILST